MTKVPIDKLKKEILRYKDKLYYEDKGNYGVIGSSFAFVKIDKNDFNDFDLSEIQAPPSSFPDLDHCDYYDFRFSRIRELLF